MKIDAFIKAAKNFKPTDKDIDDLCKRMDEAEKKYLEEAKRREVTTEMLNRVYSI